MVNSGKWKPITEDIPRGIVLLVRRPLNDGKWFAYELWAVGEHNTVERAGIVPMESGKPFAFAHAPAQNHLSNLVNSGCGWRYINDGS